MQRLGLFGGTFNPPHMGHIYIAQEAMRLAKLDKVVFIPCGEPPHKTVEWKVEAKHRFEMTRLAISENPAFEISDIEIKEKGKSYTVKTLKRLIEYYPDTRLCFVVGGDSLRDMDKWYQPDEIFALAEIVAVNRGGIDDVLVAQKATEYRQRFGATITEINISPMDVSSSEIRGNISMGGDGMGQVPSAVLDYIEKFGIYKDSI